MPHAGAARKGVVKPRAPPLPALRTVAVCAALTVLTACWEKALFVEAEPVKFSTDCVTSILRTPPNALAMYMFACPSNRTNPG